MKNSEMGRIHSFRSATMKLQRLIHCHLERVIIHIEPCNGNSQLGSLECPETICKAQTSTGFIGCEATSNLMTMKMSICIVYSSQTKNAARVDGGSYYTHCKQV